MTTTAPPAPPGDLPGVTRRHSFGDLYHERTNFQFVAHSRRWAVLSTVLVLVGLTALVVRGLNFSIEFEGGTAWQVEMADGRDASVSEVRDLLAPLGFAGAKISVLSGQGEQRVRVQAEVLRDPVRVLQRAVAARAGLTEADVLFQRTAAGGTFTFVPPEGSTVAAGDVEAALAEAEADAGDVEVAVADDGTFTVRLPTLPESPLQQVTAALAGYAGVDVADVSISTVGPTWGEQVTRQALEALLIFVLLLAAYLSFRFEWKMAAAAIFAMLHDIVVTVGFYAVFQFTVSPATVIAFLTILGFSLYDTVVVFDKVRENQRALTATGRATYPEMVNMSLNNVLMRSLSTTLVAILPVLSLLIVGSVVMGATSLEEFALALAAGLLIGSYSSLFIAAPLLAHWKAKEPQYRALAERRRRTTLAAAAATTGLPTVPLDDVPEPRHAEPRGVPGPPAVGRSVAPRPRQQRRRKRR